MSDERTIKHDFGGLGIVVGVLLGMTIMVGADVFGGPDADFYDLSDALVCMGGKAPCAARAKATARIAAAEAFAAQVKAARQ